MAEQPEGKWTAVCLRIVSSELTCGDITSQIGLQPTKCHEKGTLASPRNPRSHRLESSAWILDSGLEDGADAKQHFEALLTLIEPRSDKLAVLRSSCRIEFFIGYWSGNGQGGFVLPADLISRLASLSIDWSLDLYPPTGPEDVDHTA